MLLDTVSKNWDKLIDYYHRCYLNPRYVDHSLAIINLLIRIRDNSLFPEVIAFSSHTTLCLKLATSDVEVCVQGEPYGIYEVFLYNPKSDSILDEVQVVQDQIISTLEAYLNRIDEQIV